MKRNTLRLSGLLLALALLLGGIGGCGEAALPDGEYVPDGFTFSGGSGKVTISCPSVTLADGAATATLVFSSPNYPRLVADGAEYAAQHEGKTSIFRLPVALNADMTVVGTTTAMSQPHDIEYTIHIYLGEPAPEAEEALEEDLQYWPGNPLQDSCLENSMDRGAWWAAVHRVANSWMQLSTHTCVMLVMGQGYITKCIFSTVA